MGTVAVDVDAAPFNSGGSEMYCGKWKQKKEGDLDVKIIIIITTKIVHAVLLASKRHTMTIDF